MQELRTTCLVLKDLRDPLKINSHQLTLTHCFSKQFSDHDEDSWSVIVVHQSHEVGNPPSTSSLVGLRAHNSNKSTTSSVILRPRLKPGLVGTAPALNIMEATVASTQILKKARSNRIKRCNDSRLFGGFAWSARFCFTRVVMASPE